MIKTTMKEIKQKCSINFTCSEKFTDTISAIALVNNVTVAPATGFVDSSNLDHEIFNQPLSFKMLHKHFGDEDILHIASVLPEEDRENIWREILEFDGKYYYMKLLEEYIKRLENGFFDFDIEADDMELNADIKLLLAKELGPYIHPIATLMEAYGKLPLKESAKLVLEYTK